MKSSPATAETRKAAAELDLARRLDEEQRAIEDSLREYLDQRLARLAPPDAARGPSSSDDRPRAGGIKPGRAELYFALTAVILGLLWWRVEMLTAPLKPSSPAAELGRDAAPAGDLRRQVPAAGSVSQTAETSPPSPAAPVDFDDPAAGWEAYVDAHAATVAAWLRAVSDHRGLAANRVSDLQKTNFARWAAALEQGGTLNRSQTANARLGLFEYAYGRWLTERAEPPPGDPGGGWERVDLVINDREYPREALGELLAELGLSSSFPAPNPQDPALQVAVAAAWFQTRQTSSLSRGGGSE